MMLSRLADVRVIELPCHRRDDGEIVVAEGATAVPFAIARLFVLRAPAGAERAGLAGRRAPRFGRIRLIGEDRARLPFTAPSGARETELADLPIQRLR